MTLGPTHCFDRSCRWFQGVKKPDPRTEWGEHYYCSAYPEGIPIEITEGKDLHEEVKPDQVGDYIYESDS